MKSIRIVSLGLVGVVWCVSAGRPADDERAPSDPASQSEPDADRFRDAIARFRFTRAGDEEPLVFREKPILNWVNPTRGNQKGATFVWTRKGRPAVVGSAFERTDAEGEIEEAKFAFHSVVDAKLRGELAGVRFWEPEAGIAWRSPEWAPRPAGRERLRLLQMRAIAGEYTARITYPRSKATELRLLPQPLYRYSSADQDVLDGALFAYAAGTDPEVLLLVEAVETEDGPQWRCAFARSHYWGLDVLRKREPVWEAKAVMAMGANHFNKDRHRSDPYYSFRVDGRFPR